MKVIAFYLPQYHPTAHNNEWWGEGFTEWTNVAKAKRLFWGHYQPKIPADLGFYDLRIPEVRRKQAELAKQSGIDGFCYYHYWFGNGHCELDTPFNEVLKSGKPEFPFCLCWANESWSRKFWNKDGNVSGSTLLAEQLYPGEEDYVAHFENVLPAFKDNRYIKIDGKPVFMIYRPLAFNDVNYFMNIWNTLAKKNNFPGIFFIGYTLNVVDEYKKIKDMGFDAVCSCRMKRHNKRGFGWLFRKIISYVTNSPERYNYKYVYPTLIGQEETEKRDVYPTIIPNWDHTPRSGSHGYLFTNSTPALFEKHCEDVFQKISKKDECDRIVFLKSWNEWGEGNYMEPDLKYGHGFMDALKKAKLPYMEEK
jgi:lipopolysaccharide biosynthesis protein